MFTGTLPSEALVVLQEILEKVSKDKHIYVACSGNYNIDKLAHAMGFKVHSNDVALYSKCIADYVLGERTEIKVKDERLRAIFDSWEEHPLKPFCMVLYMMRIAKFLPQKNIYQKEMLGVFEAKSKEYYKDTRERLLAKGSLDFKIEDFFYGDFVDFLKQKRGKGVGIAFPPTYKGGYEKMYQAIDETFEYKKPMYEVFDPKKAEQMHLDFLENDENIIFTDIEFPALQKFETALISLGTGKHKIHCYSSVGMEKKYYVEKKETPQRSKYPTLPLDFEFTEKTDIYVQLVKMADVNYFKAFYMANKVNYTYNGTIGLMFFADGYAFGFASLSDKAIGKPGIILGLSDFVVNSHTPKLSKLLIMLELSTEVRLLLAKELMEYYKYISTPVYTNSPVSMKYRGVFKLEKREPGKLTYVGEFTDKTINEIYKTWLKKYKK